MGERIGERSDRRAVAGICLQHRRTAHSACRRGRALAQAGRPRRISGASVAAWRPQRGKQRFAAPYIASRAWSAFSVTSSVLGERSPKRSVGQEADRVKGLGGSGRGGVGVTPGLVGTCVFRFVTRCGRDIRRWHRVQRMCEAHRLRGIGRLPAIRGRRPPALRGPCGGRPAAAKRPSAYGERALSTLDGFGWGCRQSRKTRTTPQRPGAVRPARLLITRQDSYIRVPQDVDAYEAGVDALRSGSRSGEVT